VCIARSAPAPHGMNASAPAPHGMNASAPAPHGMNASAPAPHGMNASAPAPHGMNASAPVHHGMNASAPVHHGMNASAPVPHGMNNSAPVLHGVNMSAPTPFVRKTQQPCQGVNMQECAPTSVPIQRLYHGLNMSALAPHLIQTKQPYCGVNIQAPMLPMQSLYGTMPGQWRKLSSWANKRSETSIQENTQHVDVIDQDVENKVEDAGEIVGMSPPTNKCNVNSSTHRGHYINLNEQANCSNGHEANGDMTDEQTVHVCTEAPGPIIAKEEAEPNKHFLDHGHTKCKPPWDRSE
jgi:hypothetical protein